MLGQLGVRFFVRVGWRAWQKSLVLKHFHKKCFHGRHQMTAPILHLL